MEQSEKQHIKELEAIGFDIDYVLDSTGHLYKMHIVLPWHCVNISQEYQGKFKPGTSNAMDYTLNRAKNDITDKSCSFFKFRSTSWYMNRDFDKTMIELLDYIKKNPDAGSPVISFNFNITPEQKNDRRIDHNLSDAINTLW